MLSSAQLEMFAFEREECSLPVAQGLRAPDGFNVDRIVLTKGSLDTPERLAFVRRTCGVYPGVPVEERLDVPHNQLNLGGWGTVEGVLRGKRTLVFGELGPKSAVWGNRCQNGMYPYARFFSVYGLCPYSCSYCYLNATPLARFSPGVKVFVNLPEIMVGIDRQARAAGVPQTFYLGKMQDGLALDPLTAYSEKLVPFFASHPLARQVIQTKSAAVERLLDLEHNGHTALSWTLTPASIAARYERSSPGTEARLAAMVRCAKAGYPVCANVAPLLLDRQWEEQYLALVRELLARVPVRRIFLGGIFLEHLSLRFHTSEFGGGGAIDPPDWRKVSGGRAWSYRQGYAERFFREVVRIASRQRACRFEFSDLNGGALVVRFEEGGRFRVFPECEEGEDDSAST